MLTGPNRVRLWQRLRSSIALIFWSGGKMGISVLQQIAPYNKGFFNEQVTSNSEIQIVTVFSCSLSQYACGPDSSHDPLSRAWTPAGCESIVESRQMFSDVTNNDSWCVFSIKICITVAVNLQQHQQALRVFNMSTAWGWDHPSECRMGGWWSNKADHCRQCTSLNCFPQHVM